MNIKETIRAEIERLESKNNCGTSEFIESKRIAYEQVKEFLDSLPEQPEEKTSYDTQNCNPSPSVSIEDVARVQYASHVKLLDKKRKAVFDWEQFKEVASIFYGFGKKDSSETKEKEQPVVIRLDNPNIEKIDPNIKVETRTDGTGDIDGKAMLYVADKSYKIGFQDGKASKEQPVEGLKEEYLRFVRSDHHQYQDLIGNGGLDLARHFAEWGARRVKSND